MFDILLHVISVSLGSLLVGATLHRGENKEITLSSDNWNDKWKPKLRLIDEVIFY